MPKHPHTCPICHYKKFKTVSSRYRKFQCRKCGHRCDDLGRDLVNIEAVKTTIDDGSVPAIMNQPNNPVLV